MLTLFSALLLLVVGDFLSTFLYHVPEHVWGTYHCKVHHSPNKSFFYYAVLNKNPWVLLDGFLGALPYLAMGVVCYFIDPLGALLGLLLGQAHVWWRHTNALKWSTPERLQRFCKGLCIVTPEQHWKHHANGNVAFGDIFSFYEKPAAMWLRYLRSLK